MTNSSDIPLSASEGGHLRLPAPIQKLRPCGSKQGASSFEDPGGSCKASTSPRDVAANCVLLIADIVGVGVPERVSPSYSRVDTRPILYGHILCVNFYGGFSVKTSRFISQRDFSWGYGWVRVQDAQGGARRLDYCLRKSDVQLGSIFADGDKNTRVYILQG